MRLLPRKKKVNNIQPSNPTALTDKVVVKRKLKTGNAIITILRKDIIKNDVIIWEKGKWYKPLGKS